MFTWYLSPFFLIHCLPTERVFHFGFGMQKWQVEREAAIAYFTLPHNRCPCQQCDFCHTATPAPRCRIARTYGRFGSEEASSNNVINGQINGVEFVNTATDVVYLHDQGPGQDNQTVVLMWANRHVDDLGGMGQFSVTDNPPESEFMLVGNQTSFEEQNLSFDSAGLEEHFTQEDDDI